MSTAFSARRASLSEGDLVTTIVTLSFANDPLWAYAMARPDGSTQHCEQFWRLCVDGALINEWTWIAGSGEATSVWIPPGGIEMTEEQERQVVDFAQEHLGTSAQKFLELLGLFGDNHPRSEPHYYLSVLGTHPEHRGKGVGMHLLAHNLALIDVEGFPSYLESSNPRNNIRYAEVGFEPIGEFSYPDDGPVVTTMWRPARHG